ncbi:MAG: ATP-binding protein [Pseudomonadota bacterium]
MKLKYQLFVVLLIASALLIAAMFAANSFSFHRQFITYVNSAEIKRLEPLVEDLAERYTANGWAWVDRRAWGDILRKHSVQGRAGQLRGLKKHLKDRRSAQNGNNRSQSKHPGTWLTLVDRDRSLLVGPPPKQERMEWLPVVADKQTVGYVGFVRHQQFAREIDKEFARQQRRNFIYAALALIALCALMAAPLATRIIRPLDSVNKAIAALSGGDYSHRANIDRRDEFGDLAKNINRLGDTLEQNKAARQRWIAEISHELRTPVAVLQGEIEAIQDGIRSANPDTIASLHAEILRLSRLIDDLHQLSVSDLGALDYRMAPMDINALVTDFIDGHRQHLTNAGLEVNITGQTAWVLADHERLCQLLDNLLQNTLRYTESPGSLNVAIGAKDNHVTVVWADSSPGVSNEDLQHLFEPLYRAEKSRSRQTSGSGLGLSIVQKIVAAHSGSISADHSPDGGLQLTINLPGHS